MAWHDFPRPGLSAAVAVLMMLLVAALALLVYVRARQAAGGGFPAEEAREAAALSRAIYWGGAGEVVDDPVTGARVGFVDRPERGRLYVVFCGTDGPADMARALDVAPLETELGVLTHRGFFTQFASMRDAVERAVRAAPEDAEVVFCGHSMGAALAAIAALHLTDATGGRRVACFMFNSPHVGDARFREAFDRACPHAWHFTSPRDPLAVTTYNPLFVHVGTPVYTDPFLRTAYVGDAALPIFYRLRPPELADAAHHLFIGAPKGM